MSTDISNMTGKTALITGAAKRIGRAVARALAKNGCNVVIHYRRSQDEAQQLADELGQLNVGAFTVAADLSDPADAEGLIAKAIDAAGPVDILINNASTFPSDTLADCSTDAIIQSMQINALSPFLIARQFAGQDRPGQIVNFIDSRINDYDKAHISYHLAKRTLFGFTKMMALEFAPKVAVNGVAPGLILPPAGQDETYLEQLASSNPLNTWGDLDEIADTVLFLLKSTFITGQIIFVDGGRHLKGNVYGN